MKLTTMRRVVCCLVVLAALVGPAPRSVSAASCVVGGQSFTVTKSGRGTIDGTAGRDVILGSSARDVIRTFGGNDVVCPTGGDDDITLGDGNDRAAGGSGND